MLIRSTSPQDPSDVVFESEGASAKSIRSQVAKTRHAQQDWARSNPALRTSALQGLARALSTAAHDFATLICREVGKPITEAHGEVARAIAILDYYAQQAWDPTGSLLPEMVDDGLLFTKRHPHGLAALITPWNFPLAIPIWKAAPALAAGNAVVLKPSPEASGVASLLEETAASVIPEGIFTVVHGGDEAGQELVDTADVISFTGSTRGGLAVLQAAAARSTPVQCEMGGVNATVILADADLDHAVAAAVNSASSFAGQKCTATSRVIVVGHDRRLVQAQKVLGDQIEGLAVGDPANPSTTVGPVISDAQKARLRECVSSALRSGARQIGRPVSTPTVGSYVAPIALGDVPPGHPLAREEQFGPVFSVLRAPSLSAAVDLINQSPYGLVTSVYTNDLGASLSSVDSIRTGMIRINQPTTGVDFHAPFGGERLSSAGPREQGKAALGFFTTERTVAIAKEA